MAIFSFYVYLSQFGMNPACCYYFSRDSGTQQYVRKVSTLLDMKLFIQLETLNIYYMTGSDILSIKFT